MAAQDSGLVPDALQSRVLRHGHRSTQPAGHDRQPHAKERQRPRSHHVVAGWFVRIGCRWSGGIPIGGILQRVGRRDEAFHHRRTPCICVGCEGPSIAALRSMRVVSFVKPTNLIPLSSRTGIVNDGQYPVDALALTIDGQSAETVSGRHQRRPARSLLKLRREREPCALRQGGVHLRVILRLHGFA